MSDFELPEYYKPKHISIDTPEMKEFYEQRDAEETARLRKTFVEKTAVRLCVAAKASKRSGPNVAAECVKEAEELWEALQAAGLA